MDYNIDRKIRFSDEPEHGSLYKWSLQETDADGKQVGSDQIPWSWSNYFSASELRCYWTVEREETYSLLDDDDGDDSVPTESKPVTEREIISGKLHTGIFIDGGWDRDTRYSFFGTDRQITTFEITIVKITGSLAKEHSDAKERCTMIGFPSYTAEVDFRDDTVGDYVDVRLWLFADKFDRLVKLIQMRQINEVTLSLGSVPGFYSEWSPSVSTNRIKILAPGEPQEVKLPDDCKITPPTLGEVEAFDLSIRRRCKINLKQDVGTVDIDKLFEEDWLDDEDEINDENELDTDADQKQLFFTQLVKTENAVSSLQLPLWIIAILLAVMIFKIFF